MSLKNICFEFIKTYKVNDEDHSFYFGQFGEFKLVVDKTTGFFNATKLCKQGNKLYKNWFQLHKTKDLLQYIENRGWDPSHGFLYEILQGNKSETSKEISGTYVAKELILDIASWISPEFYLKCNDIIIKHFEYEYEKTLKQKDDKIDKLIESVNDLKIQNNQLLQQNNLALQHLEEMGIQLDDIQDQNEELNNKLDIVLPDRNIDPQTQDLKHHYVLLKNKNIDNEFMFIRGQDRHIKNKINQYKEEFEITITPTKNANPIDLVNRLKEQIKSINDNYYDSLIYQLKDSEEYQNANPSTKRSMVMRLKKENSLIVYRLNKILLNDFSEDKFLKIVKRLDQDKFDI